MNLVQLAKSLEKVVADNSPSILTGVAVVGTVSTAVLSGRGAIKAYHLIEEDDERRRLMNEPDSSDKERVMLVWKEFVPAFASGTLTIVAMVTATRIGTRRAAVMAAAYSLSEKAYVEYKDKVKEKLGENKERALRDEIAQDRVRENPTGQQILPGPGDVLCFDSYTGRYFSSSMEEIKKAQNDTNYEILHNMYASLNDFYSRLGLEMVAMGEEVGWNSDHLMEVVFSSVLANDGQPVLVMNFHVSPIRRYDKSF